jgi:hypothetical protein
MTSHRDEVIALMERHAVFGRMLPDPSDVAAVLARRDELRLIVREMRAIETAIDRLTESESRRY